ncbi:MAG: uroporphyrinogen-III synthase [Gemmataceae bacterium]|nr:uroporphyrinogen-III synthase [Gemmataceae bacterium]
MTRRVVYLLTSDRDQTVLCPFGSTIFADRACMSQCRSRKAVIPPARVEPGQEAVAVTLAAASQDTIYRVAAGTAENIKSVRHEWDVLIRKGIEVVSTSLVELPLFGRRVLVLRPAGRETGLIARLENFGAEVVFWPAIEVLPPTTWQPLDEAVARLSQVNWVVFASVHGVEAFLGRLRESKYGLSGLAKIKVAAVGPATADALEAAGMRVNLVPGVHSADGLAAELVPQLRGERVLVIRADRGRDTLETALGSVARVEPVIGYRQVDRELPPEIVELLVRGLIDNALVTSSNTARVLARAISGRESMRSRVGVVALSPITAGVCRDLGLNLVGTSAEASDSGLVSELVQIRSRSAFQPR